MNIPQWMTLAGVIVILGWAVQSLILILKVRSNGRLAVNPLLYDSIPGVFTSLGVLGTFAGILAGLWQFNPSDIDSSIPILLDGMKTAFITSVLGISLSLVFSRISKVVWNSKAEAQAEDTSTEFGVLSSILSVLKESKDDSRASMELLIREFQGLKSSIFGEEDSSLNTQILKLRNITQDAHHDVMKQFELSNELAEKSSETLVKVDKGLNGDGETSLLNQVLRMREEQSEHAKANRSNVEFIVEAMKANSDLLSKKFDEFAELMAKNNTEALVEVMKAATEEFNTQMSAIIERLVQENFDELNKSVERMNTWQHENKEMISQLTEQFKETASQFRLTSEELEKVEKTTSSLIEENGVFANMIKELNDVLIEDTKLLQSSEKLNESSKSLNETIEGVRAVSTDLKTWIDKQRSFNESYALLLNRLEDIDKIKDINEVFWNNTKKQLDEGVGLLTNGSQQLRSDLDNVNSSFYERLNDTLQSLDQLIQRIIVNYDTNIR